MLSGFLVGLYLGAYTAVSEWGRAYHKLMWLNMQGISCVGPGRNFSLWPYDKSFIDQACLVKTAAYRPSSFCFIIDLNLILVHKYTQSIRDDLFTNWKFRFDCDPRLYDLQPSCTWPFPLCILVLYGELIPPSFPKSLTGGQDKERAARWGRSTLLSQCLTIY